MKNYYQAVQREHNVWDSKTGRSPIIWDCGHNHKTAKSALNCLEKMGSAACCYHAEIEDQDENIIDKWDIENN